MSITPADIKIIVESLRVSNFDEAVVTIGDTRIEVARNGKSLSRLPAVPVIPGAPAQVAAPAALVLDAPAIAPAAESAATTAAPTFSDDHVIASPSVGVFWRSSEPGAAPFIEVGQLVQAGDTLGIVEIMKLMSNITADVSGIITAIHVENAGTVEFGTPLVSIKVEV